MAAAAQQLAHHVAAAPAQRLNTKVVEDVILVDGAQCFRILHVRIGYGIANAYIHGHFSLWKMGSYRII
jgi:hypothetical protein